MTGYDLKYRDGNGWSSATPRMRDGDGWTTPSDRTAGGAVGGTDFDWDQTFTDTNWLFEADENDDLNVEVVTTTDYEGSGSISEAVDNGADEPTVIVFEVGGSISIDGDRFAVRDDQFWFAGETAPYPGIAILDGRTRIYDDENILTHITFGAGDTDTSTYETGFTFDANDIMVDHCSAVLSPSTNTSAHTANRASLINSVIGEGLYDSIHDTSYRARGFLVNEHENSEMTHMGCLYAHNNRRQPLCRSDMIMCNNYVYNYTHNPRGTSASGSGGNLINFNSPGHPDITAVGLYFEPGAGTPDDYDRPIFSYSAELYAEDIERPDRHPLSDGDQNMLDDPPLVPDGLDIDNDILPSEDVPEFVTSIAGPRPADRPPYEAGLINERLTEDHNVIDSPSDIDPSPWDYDETSHSLDIPSSNIVDWIKREYTQAVEIGS